MGAVCPRRVPSAPFVHVGVGELPHLFTHQLPIGASVHGVHLQRREEREEREERGEVRSEVSSQNPACSSAAAVRAAAAAHHKTLLRDVLRA